MLNIIIMKIFNNERAEIDVLIFTIMERKIRNLIYNRRTFSILINARISIGAKIRFLKNSPKMFVVPHPINDLFSN